VLANRHSVLPESVASLPKAELHLHLEGSIQPSTVCALTERHGVEVTQEEVQRRYAYRNFLEFLETFSKKDVANDEQLRVLVEETRSLLNGQEISKLRKDQGLREVVQERMQSVKVVLDTLVVDAPARQIVLRD